MDNDILGFLETVTQVKRFDLANGEPFAIVIKSDDATSSDLQRIKENFQSTYSKMNHKVAIMLVGTDEDVDFFTLKELTEKAAKS